MGRADSEKYEALGYETVGRRCKGWANDFGKGAWKGGSEGYGKNVPRKGAGKGGKKGAGKGASKEKFQCQFILGIEEDLEFHVVSRVIGRGGANMKRIFADSGAKLRLRGRGSNFLEGAEEKESEDDLMLCVSCMDASSFDMARKAVSKLIEGIYQQYRTFCRREGRACPDLELTIHEGYRAGSN